MSGGRLTTALGNAMSSVNPPTNTSKLQSPGDKNDKDEKISRWIEIILDIAVTHPQGADAWKEIWPSTLQLVKSRFENSCNYSNALANLSDKALVFFKKIKKKISESLAEAFFEQWKERAGRIKIEQSEGENPN